MFLLLNLLIHINLEIEEIKQVIIVSIIICSNFARGGCPCLKAAIKYFIFLFVSTSKFQYPVKILNLKKKVVDVFVVE